MPLACTKYSQSHSNQSDFVNYAKELARLSASKSEMNTNHTPIHHYGIQLSDHIFVRRAHKIQKSLQMSKMLEPPELGNLSSFPLTTNKCQLLHYYC